MENGLLYDIIIIVVYIIGCPISITFYTDIVVNHERLGSSIRMAKTEVSSLSTSCRPTIPAHKTLARASCLCPSYSKGSLWEADGSVQVQGALQYSIQFGTAASFELQVSEEREEQPLECGISTEKQRPSSKKSSEKIRTTSKNTNLSGRKKGEDLF